MARLNWSTATARERAARQGSETVNGLAFPSSPPARRPSKADLRREIADAERKITRTIRCACGHSGQVVMLATRRHKKLRCSKCGAAQ